MAIFCIYEVVNNTHLNDPSQIIWDYPDSEWKSEETGYILKIKGDTDAYLIVGNQEKYQVHCTTAGAVAYRIEYVEETTDVTAAMYFEVTITGNENMTMTWSDFEYYSGEIEEDIEKYRKQTEEMFKKYGKIVFHQVK